MVLRWAQSNHIALKINRAFCSLIRYGGKQGRRDVAEGKVSKTRSMKRA